MPTGVVVMHGVCIGPEFRCNQWEDDQASATLDFNGEVIAFVIPLIQPLPLKNMLLSDQSELDADGAWVDLILTILLPTALAYISPTAFDPFQDARALERTVFTNAAEMDLIQRPAIRVVPGIHFSFVELGLFAVITKTQKSLAHSRMISRRWWKGTATCTCCYLSQPELNRRASEWYSPSAW